MGPNIGGLPLLQVIDVDDFFNALYVIMFPVMPFLMIMAATILAGYLIVVIRKSFSFESMTGKEEERYDFDED